MQKKSVTHHSAEVHASAYRSAGFCRRLGAIFYDSLLLGGVLFAATACLLPFNNGEALASGGWWFRIYLVLVSFLFFAGFWTHGGQTLGMRAWKIRVVSCSGKPVSWSQSLIRFGAALLSWIPLGLGYLWILFDHNKYGWHDRLSATRIEWLPDSR